MKITSQHIDGVTQISLAGDLDMATAHDLHEQVATALAREPAQTLIIDAVDLRFCDSSGIQALVETRSRAVEHGLAFRLTNAHGVTRRSLQITGVLDALTGTPDN